MRQALILGQVQVLNKDRFEELVYASGVTPDKVTISTDEMLDFYERYFSIALGGFCNESGLELKMFRGRIVGPFATDIAMVVEIDEEKLKRAAIDYVDKEWEHAEFHIHDITNVINQIIFQSVCAHDPDDFGWVPFSYHYTEEEGVEYYEVTLHMEGAKTSLSTIYQGRTNDIEEMLPWVGDIDTTWMSSEVVSDDSDYTTTGYTVLSTSGETIVFDKQRKRLS